MSAHLPSKTVIVENVDVPQEMIDAALKALDAGTMNASPCDGTANGSVPPAFLWHHGSFGTVDPGDDRTTAPVPPIAFLSEAHAPRDASIMTGAATACLRGRRVSETEIMRLHRLLSMSCTVDRERPLLSDVLVVVCASPWHPGDTMSRDAVTNEPRNIEPDPDFVACMPVAARLSMTTIRDMDAIGLSLIMEICRSDDEADAVDRLRTLQDVVANPIGSKPHA